VRTILALTAVGLLVAAQEQKKSDDPKPGAATPAAQEKGLDGTWQTESMEDSGSKYPAEDAKKWSLVITGGDFTLRLDGKKHSSGKVKFNPATNPKTFEFTFSDGPFNGQSFAGIYKLEGDTYTICYAEKGRETPKTFATKPDSQQMLVVYKKAKAG
jgi:uncharacterized protein (TIGR03067 family)